MVQTHPTQRRPAGRSLKVKRKRNVAGWRRDALKAHEKLAEKLETELGLRELPPHMTLSGCARTWIEIRSARLAYSTTAKYRNDLDKHILPALGHRFLDELKPTDIRAMLAQDRSADNARKNRLALLRAMVKDALADGLIDRDFCLRMSVKVAPVYSDEESNLLNPERLGALLAHFSDEWLDALYVIAFTGIRWCEVSGLKWSDLDLARGILRIKRSNVKGHLGPSKTRKSRRTLGLVSEVVERLQARLERMKAARHPGLRKAWVFARHDGEHYAGYPLRKHLDRACKAASITSRFTTHVLRRTYSNLARRHVDAIVLRSVVGHTIEAMTEHYSRIDIGEKREASAAVVRAVRAARPAIEGTDDGGTNGESRGTSGREATPEGSKDLSKTMKT
ncbi:MAG: tyrosine-type recombinase/integrase [Myxococcota bacterium]